MSGDSFAQLIYLVLLGSVIAGYFLVSQRRGLGRVVQQAAIWAFIFVGAVIVAGLWEDLRRTTVQADFSVTDEGELILTRSPDGHFHLTAVINNAPVNFLIDTGASDLVLTRNDAQRVGLDAAKLSYFGIAETANGRVRTAYVRLDAMEVGPFRDQNVTAAVNEGRMPHSLMGMSYLERFDRIAIEGDRMILTR